MQPTLLSKSEFAALINVSAGRVSQFIAAGQISGAAIVGSGQRAKIDVDRAKADLRLTLDVSQRLGNGVETRLDATAAPLTSSAAGFSQPASPVLIPPTGVDYEIKQQKLEQIRRANRNGAIEDAKSRGRLIDTDQSQAQMSRVAASMLEIFEGGLTDIAMAVAAEFKLPQRDVKHLMKREFRKVRETAAQQMSKKQIDLPETLEIGLDAPDIEQGDLS